MFKFTIQALPLPDSEHAEKFSGARVEAWIDFVDPWAAEILAKLYIRENGWNPGLTSDESEVSEADYTDDAKGLEHFNNAREFGAAFAYGVFRDEPAK